MDTTVLMWLNGVPFQDIVSRAQTLANRTDKVINIVDATTGRSMRTVTPCRMAQA